MATKSIPEATATLPAFSTPVPGSPGSAENPIIIGAEYAGAYDPALLDRWQEWAERLENATGLSFVVEPGPPTELELLEAMRTGEIGLAFLTPLAYAFGHERGWVKPAANAVATWNGQDARRIMFIARTGTGLHPGEPPQVFEQLKDKRPCYRKLYPQLPSLAPLEEYILPSGLLALNSVTTGAPVFVGGSDGFGNVEVGVFSKGCDFAAVDALPPEQFRNNLPEGLSDFSRWAQEMQILYTTPPINPLGVIALSSTLPQSVQAQIAHAIVSIPGLDTEIKEVDFNESLYNEFERIVAASGVDIHKYLRVSWWAPEAAISADNQWVAPPKDTLVADVPIQGGAPFLPFWIYQSLNSLVIPAIYAELARLDAGGNYFPYLAADLPTLQNGLARFTGAGEDEQFVVEFRLRPGLTWQDGQPLTADDLVFSWNLVMDPAWQGSHWGQAGGYAPEIYVASVEAPGPDRVIYRFMSQLQAREAAQTGGRLGIPSYAASLAGQSGPVVTLDYMDVGRNVFPKHLLENTTPQRIASSEFARRPVYAGAYRLVEGGEMDKPVVLEAFDDFALGRPPIKRVVFGAQYYSPQASPYWQTPDILAQALPAGAIQAQLGLPAARFREGEDASGYDVLTADALANVNWVSRGSWEVLDFNLDNPHLADLRVRQAIAHAIDRQAIIDQILLGHGEQMRSYLPAWHPLYAGDAMLPDYAYDPGQARALLEAAGYDLSQYPAVHPSRGALTLQLASMDVYVYPRPPIAAMIQEQLAGVGIQVEVEFYTWPEFEGDDCSAIRNGRKFDLGLAAWMGMDLYPLGWVEQVTAIASIPTAKNGCPYEKSNWSGWRNPEAETLRVQLHDGLLALERPDEYLELWAEHQRLWATDLPSLPLFSMERPVVTAPQLLGVRPSPFAFAGVEDTWNIFAWVLK
ncbi:MAG: ABC transporter substrate-binding protein [Anaerolineales bacterium]|nr:ABC transporter substrate-binding protein [Anaerolineales bacterium]